MKCSLFIFCFFSLHLFGQEVNHNSQIDSIKPSVVADSQPIQKSKYSTFPVWFEKPAKFNGDLKKYLSKNLHYPQKELQERISGTVYISFMVETDGSISSIKILRGVSNGSGLDKEAIRLVEQMPKWSPAMNNNKAVRMQYNLPIHFDLPN